MDEVIFVHANLLKEMPKSEFHVNHEEGVFRTFKDYTLVDGNTWLRPQMQSSRDTKSPLLRKLLMAVVHVWNFLRGKGSRIFGNDRLKSYLVSKALMIFIDGMEGWYSLTSRM